MQLRVFLVLGITLSIIGTSGCDKKDSVSAEDQIKNPPPPRPVVISESGGEYPLALYIFNQSTVTGKFIVRMEGLVRLVDVFLPTDSVWNVPANGVPYLVPQANFSFDFGTRRGSDSTYWHFEAIRIVTMNSDTTGMVVGYSGFLTKKVKAENNWELYSGVWTAERGQGSFPAHTEKEFEKLQKLFDKADRVRKED